MLARLELISFHLALFCSASIFLLLQGTGGGAVGDEALAMMLLMFGGGFVLVASLVLRTHEIARWKACRLHGASTLIAIGHAAPVLGVWLFLEMSRAHAGSGLVFLPLMAWAVVFYGIGIVQVIRGLSAPSDTGPA